MSLKPEREDFNGWKISLVKKGGKEVKGSMPSTKPIRSYRAKYPPTPVLLSLRPMILDGQQPCPAWFIAPPMHRQALPYPTAFPSFPAGTSMAPSFATCASSVAPCSCHGCGHGGVSLMPCLFFFPPQCLLSVTSSPNAPVGKYNLHVKTGTNIYKPENGVIYLLFNPWCKGEWSCNWE